MIDFYYWPTPNNEKIAIMLEETRLDYEIRPVNIRRGDQHGAEFRAINPNGKVPAIVDHDPIGGGAPLTVFESGIILFYLARKSGGMFLPAAPREHYEIVQWVMWQAANLGPMAGQASHFLNHAPEKIAYAVSRYTRELARLYRILDDRLARRPFIAGAYSVADMACWPWVWRWKRHGQDLEGAPHLRRWLDRIGERAAVKRALALAAGLADADAPLDECARTALFGAAGERR
jgi:GST-like protein